MRRIWKYLSLSVAILLLSSCAKLIEPRPVATQYFTYKPWMVREDELQAITKWNISGAFSIQQGGKAHIANYTWAQVGQTYNIFIRSSFDILGAQIKGGPSWAWLYRGDRIPVKAHSPEMLMQKELGYSLPISDLTFWVRGMPAASKYNAKFDSFGHMKSLRQDGWRITFSHYTAFDKSSVEKADVPRVLTLARRGLKIKIVVNSWG